VIINTNGGLPAGSLWSLNVVFEVVQYRPPSLW